MEMGMGMGIKMVGLLEEKLVDLEYIQYCYHLSNPHNAWLLRTVQVPWSIVHISENILLLVFSPIDLCLLGRTLPSSARGCEAQ
jgi:hypothetical protein